MKALAEGSDSAESAMWAAVIIAGHEVGHIVANHYGLTDLAPRPWEAMADCIAGAYVGIRYKDVLPDDIGASAWYVVESMDGVGEDNREAFSVGWVTNADATPQQTLQRCIDKVG